MFGIITLFFYCLLDYIYGHFCHIMHKCLRIHVMCAHLTITLWSNIKV